METHSSPEGRGGALEGPPLCAPQDEEEGEEEAEELLGVPTTTAVWQQWKLQGSPPPQLTAAPPPADSPPPPPKGSSNPTPHSRRAPLWQQRHQRSFCAFIEKSHGIEDGNTNSKSHLVSLGGDKGGGGGQQSFSPKSSGQWEALHCGAE